jgi:hypothetical protein
MQDIAIYEVLKVRYDDEGNESFYGESGIFFSTEGEALAFVASDRYYEMFSERAEKRNKETLNRFVCKRVLKVFDNVAEYDTFASLRDREIALNKLSDRERKLLGL